MKIYEVKILKEEADGYVTTTRLKPLDVKVNKESVEYGITYNLDNTNTILFKETLQAGDIIQVEFETNLTKVVSKNPHSKNSIYPIFTSDVKFKLNHKYEFSIKADEVYTTKFQSKFDPFFSTIKTIRRDTGDLFDKVSDEVIANVIYENSKAAVDKLIDIDNGDVLSDLYDHEDFEYRIPPYVKNYVRYKTDIDLCYSVFLSKTGKLGAFSKKIGDLDISNEVKLPELNEMISRFRELLRPNEDLLSGDDESDFTVGFVKAKSTSYTVANRGVF